MDKDALQARREYGRKWRTRNKEKCKEYQDRYWKRVAERKAALKSDAKEQERVQA
jgi:hypothetical protein